MTSNLMTRYIVIIFVLALAGTCISMNWPVSLGIDLRGGSILTYKIKPLEGEGGDTEIEDPVQLQQAVADTLGVISQRINKEGVKDIAVRQEGRDHIVITLPNFTAAQTSQIRERMTQMGQLLMPIVATDGDEAYGIRFTRTKFDEERRAKQEQYEAPKGFVWFPRRPERREKETEESYKKRLENYSQRRVESPWDIEGEWFFFDPDFWDPDLAIDAGEYGFSGRHIYAPRRDIDQNGGRAVAYRVKESRQWALGAYSERYMRRQMALVLNGEMWSAATIQGKLTDNVQITRGAGGYSEEEQKWLLNCLQAGSLKLKPVLESQEEVGATLGATAIERGRIAFLIGGIAVMFFMLFYYRLSGMFAVIALILNFVLVFGILMLLQASLTLPGLAGLVLTVGMAVDANILIFERIREELDKGKRLIHAAKNGFDRAFVTIFDANLTTFIVAAFLVYYGKGPIKGFGYVLMAGIVCSMFSGLYITRALLGTAIARGKMDKLKMLRLFERPSIRFFKMAPKFLCGSVVVIILGLTAFFMTGKEKFGLDFNGGTAVQMRFTEPMKDTSTLR